MIVIYSINNLPCFSRQSRLPSIAIPIFDAAILAISPCCQISQHLFIAKYIIEIRLKFNFKGKNLKAHFASEMLIFVFLKSFFLNFGLL
jgi:hypothetical protein